jgi:hypothetical protein
MQNTVPNWSSALRFMERNYACWAMHSSNFTDEHWLESIRENS